MIVVSGRIYVRSGARRRICRAFCSTICRTLGRQPRDGGKDLAHKLQRQPYRRLVEQQQARLCHQATPDRHYLLLAAR
jgi:hypothetical protein